jgi:hypothetical protein
MLVVAVRRRTTVRWAGVLVAVGGLTGCGSGSSGPITGPPPAHHTIQRSARPASAQPVVDFGGSARIIGDPDVRLASYSTIPGHPERRIAEWARCPDRACHRPTYALVVTGDGFRTSHVVQVPPSRVANGWYLEPEGARHFSISPNGGRRSLVGLDGRVTAVEVSGAPGPLAGREVPLPIAKGRFGAVDPTTGAAHPLSTPPGTVELLSTPDGQLRVATVHWRYLWSDDRGAAWHDIPIPAGDRGLMMGMVPTTSGSVQAVQLGGDGATLFPWDHVLRSTDGRTWTSYDGPGTPHAYGSVTAVLPDGELLVDVEAWSDQRAHRPPARPVGLYAGPDWSRASPVALSGPFAHQDPHTFDPTILDVAVTVRSVTIYAATPDERGVVYSADGGHTWRPVRAR